jgi:hypothetical protein
MIIKQFKRDQSVNLYATVKPLKQGGICLETETITIELSMNSVWELTSILLEQIIDKRDKARAVIELSNTPGNRV